MTHGICPICKMEKKLREHHISYIPSRVCFLCSGCHSKIHRTGKYLFLRPPKHRVKIYHSSKGDIRGKYQRSIRGLTPKEVLLKKKMKRVKKRVVSFEQVQKLMSKVPDFTLVGEYVALTHEEFVLITVALEKVAGNTDVLAHHAKESAKKLLEKVRYLDTLYLDRMEE